MGLTYGVGLGMYKLSSVGALMMAGDQAEQGVEDAAAARQPGEEQQEVQPRNSRRTWSVPVLRILQLTTGRRLDVLLQSVGHRVRQEIDCLSQDERGDPAAILQLRHLMQVYGEQQSVTHLTAAFFEVRQRQGEGVLNYFHHLLAAARAAQKKSATTVDDALLSRQCVEGLQDRTLARILVRELDARPTPYFKKMSQQALQKKQVQEFFWQNSISR